MVRMTLDEAIRLTREETKKHPERLERLRNMKDEDIDYSDIREFTDEELKRAIPIRLGRPLLGLSPRQLISIKLDLRLIADLKHIALERKTKYQSLIHSILEDWVKKQKKAT